uniref:ABC transporter ATP-binding protein n=1 Tax=Thermosipho ferrireducens TaxID=2571116 RepID=UPI002B1BDF76|nr:ABC transporter ATP-binding protein [Thermosipho ferrireducens]
MLEVKGITIKYDNILAVDKASLYVKNNEIVALIGANGAGKSSILNSIMGFIKPEEGKIVFGSKDITIFPAWKRAKLGLGIVPEGGRIFSNLTVFENFEIAGIHYSKKSFEEKLRFIFEIFPRLEERKKQLASTLSGGEKQMLAIGRLLMFSPKLLLLDEISLGLMPKLVDEIFEVVQKLKKLGFTILLSEQNTKKALQVSDRAYVVQNGKIVLSGFSKELINNEKVRRAYLGL